MQNDQPVIAEIISITIINAIADSFDVTTSSEHFIVNNIYTHNCRAAVSRWFERGGMTPADENDRCIMDGRFNMGAISLHFSMIAAKARKEDKDFYDVLYQYLEMTRDIHKRTVEFLSHKKASTNPLGFCQGGFYGGHLDPDQEIGVEFLRPMTISFGIIGLNEASVFWTGKAIHEDNSWAIDVLKYINEYVDRIKKEDNIAYAIYGTPGESLVATQVTQFRKKYGIIKGVSDHDYVTNSFHCPVYADITPIEKQDAEYPMFHLVNGGQISYARMRSNYNFEAFKAITRRAMRLGLYWGNNQQLNFCEKCGHEFIDNDCCPKCKSTHITRIERMNGYLGYSSIRGKTMYSDTKLNEFSERISM
jgi:ribonucleoside-triphosphate reductase